MDRTSVSGVLLLMLCANETITIVHHSALANSDAYSCSVCVGVSWFGKRGMSSSASGGQAPTMSYIPSDVVPEDLPMAGDIIVKGILASYTGKSCLSSMEHFVVGQVGDNRRAICTPHVVVRSE